MQKINSIAKVKIRSVKTGNGLIAFPNIFPVVGIGASAGGLDAFKKLIKEIPENSGMAFVLVQHLNPRHESTLPELLQKVTTIPVLEITDDIKVEPNHIYIIPSNKMMIANDGILLLSPRPINKNEPNLPIDLFFSSLAEVHQSHSIGVVLSGTASDGTKGLKAIKDHGGITFAQSEKSAAYDGMPLSAIQAGVVDFILPPEQIPQKLMEVTKIINGKHIEAADNIPVKDEDAYRQILALLRMRKGTDFTYYKQGTIRRRMLRRMALNKMEEFDAYLNFLKENKTEQDVLFQDLLIPVTSFFRDSKSFNNLYETVFPQLLKNKKEGEPIRVWVAGCSTGQEVYSIAICFRELLKEHWQTVQIFATDISEPAIAKARSGIYSKNELDGLSPERLQDYFIKNNAGYQAKQGVRDICVFAVHNFLKDPPFGKLDFISCRNVLIYMEPYLQKKALTTFHYALNQKGFLLLGKSETINNVPELFTYYMKHDKIFSRKDVPGKFITVASSATEQKLLNTYAAPRPGGTVSDTEKSGRTDFQKMADEIVLSKFTPAGVVVNEIMDIVHFRGKTGDYLEQLPGKPSHNLLKMAKGGLAFELRNILHKSKKENTAVTKADIPVQVNGNLRTIAIEVIPLPNTIEPHYLILFHENALTDTGQNGTGIPQTAGSKLKDNSKDLRIAQLEKELAQVREDVRSITEDQEAVNEELQTANEEMLSGNEEMQSLIEEMETSKEELQSTNEELTVVNQEMIGLNEQVTEAKNYAETVIANHPAPLLVLDRNLRIKTANIAFYKTFLVNESETEDRLIYQLGNNQWDIPELRKLLEDILPKKTKLNGFEVRHKFQSIGERIMLLNAREIARDTQREKLILLAIEDITERAEGERVRSLLANIINTSEDAILSKTLDGIITSWNNGAEKMFGYSAKEAIGKHISIIIPPDLLQEEDVIMSKIKKGLSKHFDTIRLAKNGNRLNISVTISPTKDSEGNVTGASKIARDNTEQVNAVKKIKESEERYHHLIYSSPSAIGVLQGEDFIITHANDAIIAIWGKGKEIMGKPYFEALPELAEQGYREIFNRVYTTGEPFNAVEMPVNILQNEKFESKYYNFLLYAQRNINNEIDGVGIIATEVTTQALINKKIKVSEERFRLLVLQAPVAICIMRGEKYIVEIINESVCELWDKTMEQSLNKPLFDVLPEIKDQGLKELLDNVYQTGERCVVPELPLNLLRNGKLELIYLRFVYEPLRETDGTISGVMALAHEITGQVLARKKIEESEAHFRQLTDLMPSKISNADIEGNLLYYNKQWLDFLGLSADKVKDFNYHKIIHPDELEEFQNRFKKAAETGTNIEMEMRFLNKEGKYIWHLNLASPVKDENGNIKMWIGTATEIQRLKEEDQRKGDFLKMVSHELNTPVTSIKGYVQLLLSILKEDEKTPLAVLQTPLLRINNQIGRLGTLISEMLDLSKLDTGKLELQKDIFNLRELVAETIQDIVFTNTNHVINFTGNFEASVYGDRNRIGQVIINLVNNAIKYSPNNNQVDLHIYSTGNKQVAVSVTDYGIGIDKVHQQNIFQRFYRAGGISEKNYAGFGIGLFIAAEIIERHHGVIHVESEMDKGSTFTVILPIEAKTKQ